MSYLIHQESACTYCHTPNEVEVWSIVNVKTDPELRDLLLGGELNMAECAFCKEFFYAEHFLLYHDPAYELMAFVYPHDNQEEKAKWEAKTAEDFARTQAEAPPEGKLAYFPVTLFGLDQLVFFVEDEEERSVQAEIVALLAVDHGFRVRALRPWEARQKNVPPIVPYLGADNQIDRVTVLAGLEKLKSVNDRLFVYTAFEEAVRKNPDWSLNG